MNLTRGINLRKIAEQMPGASGAEVKVALLCVYVCMPPLMSCDCHVTCTVQGVCTEAGMYALRERRVHVTQEDFEMAVAKVQSLLWILEGHCCTVFLSSMLLPSLPSLHST